MVKMLLLSDTHGNLGPARRIITHINPDQILHLGDMIADARKLRMEFPQNPMMYVPGNCDMLPTGTLFSAITEVDGCRIFYTHGHEQHVKLSLMRLELAARESQVQVAAFGHTHQPYCECINGLWLVNPGSAHYKMNYALIEIDNGVPCCSLHTIE